ncbi:alpha/beta fold hydrolase [Pontibaca salina]|nr:alpha/beta hydrolase [Pontibaca salina]
MDGSLPEGTAYWVHTSDGVRIRVAHWGVSQAHGTILLLPGRTEYVEKYAQTAGEFGQRGFDVIALDWRGQGLSDRLVKNVRLGHVARFTDYQQDLTATVRLAQELDLTRPWHLLGHSMGAAIGLRAVMEGLAVQSCAFTGPMWGISISPLMRPLGWSLSHLAPLIGRGLHLTPSTQIDSYVELAPFKDNMLTSDPDTYAMMKAQLAAHPKLSLGGPSLIWLREALRECRTLAARRSPDLPCLTFIGEGEQIIDRAAVLARMRRWPRGMLEITKGARHEILMETPAIRAHVLDWIADFFTQSRRPIKISQRV